MAKRTTRERMVDSAIVLLRERGANAVTVDAVLAHSRTPRGSVYHHFPGGRDQLVLEAVARAGDSISASLAQAVSARDPQAAVESLVAFWKAQLLASDFRAGCPVVALAVDSRSDLPDAHTTVCDTFATWHTHLVKMLTTDGHSPARAERLATMLVASIEGALILCRAQASTTPLDDVAAEITLLLNTRDRKDQP